MTLLVRVPNNRASARRYVLDVVLHEWLGFEYELVGEARTDISIRLGGDPQQRELIVADVLLATPSGDWLSEASMPVRPLPRVVADAGLLPDASESGPSRPAVPLPVLFGNLDGRPWVRSSAREIDLGIDIFGSAFFMLTRYEEIVGRKRDAHDRFPASASLASAEGFLDRPLVDEYVDLLWLAMHTLWPGLQRLKTSFRLRLTHDVDRPWAAIGQSPGLVAHAIAGDLGRRRDPALAARRALALLNSRSGRVGRDPFNTFDLLMDTSERHGLRSTFYFMTGATDPRYDGSYEINDPPVQRLLRQVHERGHEIGLHTSYNTFKSTQQLRIELDRLTTICRSLGIDQPSWGARQHYLRFAAPATWRHQAGAGLSHDSSLGFAAKNGFRGGTCREYPIFDPIELVSLPIRERPLIFMDAASPDFQALDFRATATRVQALVATCRRHDGDAVVLYHNSSLPGGRAQAHYRELIESLVQPG